MSREVIDFRLSCTEAVTALSMIVNVLRKNAHLGGVTAGGKPAERSTEIATVSVNPNLEQGQIGVRKSGLPNLKEGDYPPMPKCKPPRV